jgi:Fe-S cluster assembly ATP-binding protein
MLRIEDLHAAVDGKAILKGISLTIDAGEIHAIMGPNGSGKSTLSYVLAGRPGYEVTGGTVTLQTSGEGGIDLLALDPHERAAAGMFLGFQYPVEIPGVSNVQFLRTALNAQRRARGEAELSAGDFLRLARQQGDALGLSMDMMKRHVNVGFSGINRIMRKPDKAVLLITHYQRLLDLVRPDHVHVLAGGRIVRSGGPELAHELERDGYGSIAA